MLLPLPPLGLEFDLMPLEQGIPHTTSLCDDLSIMDMMFSALSHLGGVLYLLRVDDLMRAMAP